MTTNTVSPLPQRMIEDMNARKLCTGTQRGHTHPIGRGLEASKARTLHTALGRRRVPRTPPSG